MKAAYGTFLSSLLMIKAHDMVVDQSAAEFNVTWSRTTPIIVSVIDDTYLTVLTLECDHRFGMDVIGDPQNIVAFRYACSAAINPIEHWVMQTLFPGGNGTSITIGLGQMILNGEFVDIFMSNGYLVMKSASNDLFLVIDPVTGLVRDVMITSVMISGSYCFSDLQTEWGVDLGEELLTNPPVWVGMISTASTVGGTSFLGVLTNPVVLTIAAGVVVGYAIFQYCVDQGWLPPERCREILGSISPPFAVINMLLYDETPTFYVYNPSHWPFYDKNFNPLSERDWVNYFKTQSVQNMRISEEQYVENVVSVIGTIPGGDKYDEVGQVIDALSRDAGKRFYKAYCKFNEGNIAGGTVDATVALVEVQYAILLKIAFP